MPLRPNDAALLSATVITHDEADRIADCLASLAFCDEIVVVDSGSTDATREIAQRMGARVLQRPFDGFRSQKQFAVEQATHDWVLCVDADERIDATLREAILAERAAGFARAAGYRFARKSWYLGRWLRHGNAYPDRKLRLFDRRRGGWRGTREVHESASVDGKAALLRGELLHLPFRSFAHQLAKSQRYAQMMAEHAHARGRRVSWSKLVLAPAWRFWRGYLLRGGFLDGRAGLVYAYVTAFTARQKAIRLWLLQQADADAGAGAAQDGIAVPGQVPSQPHG